MAISEFSTENNADTGTSNEQSGENLSYGTIKTQYDGSTEPRIKFISLGANKGINKLQTSSGQLHGFEHNGNIGLFTKDMDLSAPLHEYTHAWDAKLQQHYEKNTINNFIC